MLLLFLSVIVFWGWVKINGTVASPEHDLLLNARYFCADNSVMKIGNSVMKIGNYVMKIGNSVMKIEWKWK